MGTAAALKPELRSLLVDLPNHGRSGWTEHFDYTQIADLVAAHVQARSEDHAAGSQVDLVGHSMGGKVAMVLALRHPELVRRLVVLDISPVRYAASHAGIDALLAALMRLDLTRLQSRTQADAALRDAIADNTVRGFLLQNLQISETGQLSWQPNLRLLRDERDPMMGFPELGRSTFAGPVLWVSGGNSNYVTAEHLPVMRSYFPLVQQSSVPNSGHWVHADQAAKVNALLRGFLIESLRTPAR